MEHFFPRIQVDTYVQLHAKVKIIRGDADVDHTQTIGGGYSQIIGGIYPSIPPRFWHPWTRIPIEIQRTLIQV